MKSQRRIIELVEKNGAKTSRPISLPTVKDLLTMTRTHRRFIDILKPTSRTVDALMGMGLTDGADIQIKL